MASNQKITINIGANISDFTSKLQSLKNQLSKVTLPGLKGEELNNTFIKLERAVQSFGEKTSIAFGKSDIKGIEKDLSVIESSFLSLEKQITSLGKMKDADLLNLLPKNLVKNIRSAALAFDNFKKEIKEANIPTKELTKAQKNLTKAQNDFNEAQSKTKVSKDVYTDAKIKTDNLKKSLEEAEDKLGQIKQVYKSKNWNPESTRPNSKAAQGVRLEISSGEITSVKEMTEEVEKLRQQYEEAKNKQDQLIKYSDYQKLERSLENAKNKVANLSQEFDKIKIEKVTLAFNTLKSSLSGIEGIDLSEINTVNDIDKLETQIQQLSDISLKQAKNAIDEWKASLGGAKPQISEFSNEVNKANSALKTSEETARELENARNHLMQFFGIAGTINIFRRAIRNAFQTIKELDAAMTETAVVTDFTVGDMWDELPRYTKAANELGATTLGAYETMTLFYQQGLETNEVFEIGTETMKMARIAGLDYAQATDLMTAALRGFNMELDTVSAQRINDVYSELAAITAADTEEIATAMTKTASIANSANMEFETTAAFLSQMIETTREPAENLGTAMKTIIARFTEMKKAPNGIIDVEGEEVDVNKVDTALKSVGISLKDASGEFRDLDDVFIELAQKWDSLTVMQQRYIATTAAGSRLSVNRLRLAA